MFDRLTSELITSAPPLEQLDLNKLPEEMTKAYTTIISTRLMLLTGETYSNEDLDHILERFRRLANTYEAFVAVLPERREKTAAAFVAASAHHLLYLATKLRPNLRRSTNRLNRSAISSDVSAMLLFLIAGYPSDAMAMAKQISGQGCPKIIATLLEALANLAQGKLVDILSAQLPGLPNSKNEDLDQVATNLLWLRLLEGIRTLASQLLGQETENNSDAEKTFSAVKTDSIAELSFSELDRRFDNKNGAPMTYNMFPGPHHLASLLIQVGKTLIGQAIINIPPPSGVNSDKWHKYLRRAAEHRPYLWQNHVQAISSGYLDVGTSAVISFPTGAGKSTLAELKIATALFRKRSVIFLAPTHALIGQVLNDLRKAFPDFRVRSSLLEGGEYAELEFDDNLQTPLIAVMTPERCLTLVGISPNAFASCGLIVFDECHLLHPPQDGNMRRSIDAMLCLLNVMTVAPEADILLLSAMLKNAKELAGWLEELLNRSCVSLELVWKPTRQARGCVVYDHEKINKLTEKLDIEKAEAPQKINRKGEKVISPPSKAVKESQRAMPYGLFCLHQTWNTRNSEDYKHLPLVEYVSLSVNNYWKLTPNRNEVASAIASRLARLGIRTLIFLQKITDTKAVASSVAGRLIEDVEEISLTEQEKLLLNSLTTELGDEEHVYKAFQGRAVCHHSLLLPVERHLNENIFRRDDGVKILATTPTLAQGMNLPAEAVIIAGDDRFDSSKSEKMKILEAHELLNAAGRAGRAGHMPQGLVIVIPGAVVGMDFKAGKIDERWFKLQDQILSQSDQCLEIQDPVKLFLDLLQDSTNEITPQARYFLNRLPRDTDEINSKSKALFARTLSAYQARKRSEEEVYNRRVEIALSRRKSIIGANRQSIFYEDIAARTGTDLIIVESLYQAILSEIQMHAFSITKWLQWFFDWLEQSPETIFSLIKVETLRDVFGDIIQKDTQLNATIALQIIPKLHTTTRAWIAGSTLRNLELLLDTPEHKLKYCDKARKFVLRCMPELAYAIGLIALIYRDYLTQEASDKQMPLALATLAPCVREGLDRPEKLAIYYATKSKPNFCRVICHKTFDQISKHIAVTTPFESFEMVRHRVRSALDHFEI